MSKDNTVTYMCMPKNHCNINNTISYTHINLLTIYTVVFRISILKLNY